MTNDIVERIEIELDQREAQKLLDCVNAALNSGNQDEVLIEFACQLGTEIRKFGSSDLEIIE